MNYQLLQREYKLYSKADLLKIAYMAKSGKLVPSRKDGRPVPCLTPDDLPFYPAAKFFMQLAMGRKAKTTTYGLKEAFERYDDRYSKECDKWVDLNLHRLYGLIAEQGEELRQNDEVQKRILLQKKCNSSSEYLDGKQLAALN